jgi:hypothetical protein
MPLQRRLISMDHDVPALSRGTMNPHENPEAAANRIMTTASAEYMLELPRLKTHMSLATVDGVHGIVMVPPTEHDINLRRFTVRAYDFYNIDEQIQRDIAHEQAGEDDLVRIDLIDRQFLIQAMSRRVRL